MNDLVGLLMIEHSAIRHISKYFNFNNEDDLAGFHEYLKNVHIELEEKIVFPLLISTDDYRSKDLAPTIDQLKVDHKSIDDLARNILTLWANEDKVTAVDKTKLYFRLLKDHNNSEDSSIFLLWKNVDEKEMVTAMKEAENIIDSFGRELYTELMALSPAAYSYLTATQKK
ncbi:MAG: hemerythrin domain-containing protein [Thermoplasmatales archaeon]|jgi:hemerythrin superfamily protein|nr:hemerythrin domain-containing protein [Thermoplasmatales archaeon]